MDISCSSNSFGINLSTKYNPYFKESSSRPVSGLRDISPASAADDIETDDSDIESRQCRRRAAIASFHRPVPGSRRISSESGSTDVTTSDSDKNGRQSKKKKISCSVYTIFEIKCNSDFTNVHSGLCQLLSFSLSARHEKKLAMCLCLILVTPTNWFVMILPPYGDQLPSPIACFSIKLFIKIQGYLIRDNLIWMLKFLHIAPGVGNEDRSHEKLISHLMAAVLL